MYLEFQTQNELSPLGGLADSLQSIVGRILRPRDLDVSRLRHKVAAFGLISMLALNLVACGKDSTPTVTHVWDAKVGTPLCGGYTISLLERKNADDVLEGFRAQASNPEGDIVDLIVDESFYCDEGVKFTTLSLANTGKPAVSGRISDYN